MKKLISYMMCVVLLASMTTVISAKGKDITPNHGWHMCIHGEIIT